MITRLLAAALAALSFVPSAASAIQHATAPVNALTRDRLIGSGTLIKIAMVQTISSAFSKAGDKFSFRVIQDVMAGDRLAIPAGTIGTGKVTDAKRAGMGRADGRLHVEFDPIALADGTNVSVAITRASLIADENTKNEMAGSIEEIADIAIPGAFLLDFLRKGDEVTLGANRPFHIAATEDVFLTQPAH